ncbi:MAG: hypothetical protein HY721_30610 [Planctomycetes bacterium]|nr:hypothetical protein [Planctomycetota bacterium]
MASRRSLTLIGLVLLSGVAGSQDCPLGPFEEVTDDFYFTASSDQGAVGDVVAVDISLTIEQLHGYMIGFSARGCYDSSKADLLGQPVYSEIFDQLTPVASEFVVLPPEEGTTTRLFNLNGVTNNEVLGKLFPSADPVHLATVFFRLKGVPGDAPKVEFCDFRRKGPGCIRSSLYYAPDGKQERLVAFSTRHGAGELRTLPGEPTRPDPPALPPGAKIYPEPPTAENASIVFELTGAVARPGDPDVPLGLYVTSNFEFSGFAVSLTFDPRHLRLARLEEHTRPAAAKLDNEKGQLGMYTSGTRRIGAEGERVRIATLHFSVTQEASEVSEATPKLEPFGPYLNWLEIRYAAGAGAETVPITAEVTPLIVNSGLLKIQRRPTVPGDVDLSYDLDLSDAVAILSDLFLGTQQVLCQPAADFNADGAINITDPIAILNYLFLGGPAAKPRDVYCTP